LRVIILPLLIAPSRIWLLLSFSGVRSML
jgi:hypothetical protein